MLERLMQGQEKLVDACLVTNERRKDSWRPIQLQANTGRTCGGHAVYVLDRCKNVTLQLTYQPTFLNLVHHRTNFELHGISNNFEIRSTWAIILYALLNIM